MLNQNIQAQIKLLEIKARHLLSGTSVGDHTTAQKGSGFEFDQLREYQQGDDVRFIDWQATARGQKVLVRQYFEERNRTIIPIVDFSPSTYFGSTETLKSELITQLAGIIALVADYGKDAVGLCITGIDVKPIIIPPKQGRVHVRRLLEKLFLAAERLSLRQSSGVVNMQNDTNRAHPELIEGSERENRHAKSQNQLVHPLKLSTITDGLNELRSLFHKKPLLVIVSDFIDHEADISWAVAAKRAEVVAIRCLDAVERAVPAAGIMWSEDIEHASRTLLPLERGAQKNINNLLQERVRVQELNFKKYGIDLLDVTPGQQYLHDLIWFFRKRRGY